MRRRRQLMLGAGIGALLLPLAGLAQSNATVLSIGWISLADPGNPLDDFRAGLEALGYSGARAPRIELRIA